MNALQVFCRLQQLRIKAALLRQQAKPIPEAPEAPYFLTHKAESTRARIFPHHHGTLYAFQRLKCRCPMCLAAHREYMRAYKQRKRDTEYVRRREVKQAMKVAQMTLRAQEVSHV